MVKRAAEVPWGDGREEKQASVFTGDNCLRESSRTWEPVQRSVGELSLPNSDTDPGISVPPQPCHSFSICSKAAGVRFRGLCSTDILAEATKHCNCDSVSLCPGVSFPAVTVYL